MAKVGTKVCILVVAMLAMSVGTATASVNPIKLGANSDSFNASGGVKGTGMEQVAQHGAAMMRFEMIEGTPVQGVLTPSMDTAVTTYANDGLTLYPILGIPDSRATGNFVTDSQTLDDYLTQFIQRFGNNGTFWSQNPSVPYHPITQFEIGNEVNVPPGQPIADNTNMHFNTAGAYAYVYAHAYSTLHNLKTGVRVIVGGLAPTAASSVVTWLGSFYDSPNLTTSVDSVGFHPYLLTDNTLAPHSLAQMESQTTAVHNVGINHGFPNTKVDLNEFDSDAGSVGTSAAWGQDTVQFMDWSFCSNAWVVDFQPEWWGGTSGADTNTFFPLAHDDGTLTDYGTAYLNEVTRLTTTGC